MRVNMFRKHVTKYLSAYCHGELTAVAAQQVTAHLASCERCQNEYEAIQVGIKLAAQLQVTAAPMSLWSGVRAKLDTSPTRPWIVWKYAWAATALVFVGLGSWFVIQRQQEKKDQVAMQRNHEIVSVTLSVNSSVTPSPAEKSSPLLTPTLPSKAGRAVRADLTWEVASVTGAPRIGDEKIKDTGKLGVGEWLETDNDSTAKLKVAEIGYVDIDPNSRVQLVRTKETEHRISLAKGKLSALILAPPRLFIVDTPSATAVDLGCAYTLEVDELGASILHVTSGWVSFVRNGRESFIPAGAMCQTRKGSGLGTPYFADASATFKTALHSLDFEKHAKVGVLVKSLLTEAREQDALTLWHLLGRQFQERPLELRGQIYDRLVELTPPPVGITRTGILSGNQKMLATWWEDKIR